MQLIQTSKHRGFFKVMTSTREAQAAMMVLRPGQSSGEPADEHPWGGAVAVRNFWKRPRSRVESIGFAEGQFSAVD
jgi:hypothetical protein